MVRKPRFQANPYMMPGARTGSRGPSEVEKQIQIPTSSGNRKEYSVKIGVPRIVALAAMKKMK